MNLVSLFCALSLTSTIASAGGPVVIDHCYTGVDSDDSSGPEWNQPVDVTIYQDARGYYAHVKNQTTHEVLAEKMPVEMMFDRTKQAASWAYRSLESSDKSSSGLLEIYRTSVKTRSPTSVNAHLHFHYRDQSGELKTIAQQRLECEKLNL